MKITFHKDAEKVSFIECTISDGLPECKHRTFVMMKKTVCAAFGSCEHKKVWHGYVQPEEDGELS